MNGQTPKTLILSLLAVIGGVFLFQRIRCARRAGSEPDATLDAMVEQSFPASDAPAY